LTGGIPAGFKICAGVSKLNSCRLTAEHPKRLIIKEIKSNNQRKKNVFNIQKKIIFKNTYVAIVKPVLAKHR
jgi:hypothetical protein